MTLQKTHARLAGLLALIGVVVYLSLTLDPGQLFDPERLRALSQQNLWQAGAIFVVTGVAVKTLFLPVSPLSIAAGLIFGAAAGSAIALITLITSSLLMFGLARWLGRGFVERFVDTSGERLEMVERILEEHGLLAVIILRIVPTLPISAVNMLLGLSAVRTRDFIIGTLIGFIPGTIILANIGSRALEPMSAGFWVSIGLFGLLILAGIGVAEWLRRGQA